MRFARSQVIFWSTLLLLLLSACGSAPVQPSPTHAGTTPTLTFPPTPTNIPLPFLPNDHDPFQATFIERAPVTTCPPSSKPTDLCFHVSGTGTSIPYGSLSFTSFDINFLQPGGTSAINSENPHSCEPTTRQGSLSTITLLLRHCSLLADSCSPAAITCVLRKNRNASLKTARSCLQLFPSSSRPLKQGQRAHLRETHAIIIQNTIDTGANHERCL